MDYTDVAEVIRHATGWLFHVWRSLLPHMYMTYTATLINSARTNLYVGDAPAGFPTGAEQIEYSDVVEKGAEEDRVVFYALERVARTYGLVLDSLFDSRGTLLRPRRMSNSEV